MNSRIKYQTCVPIEGDPNRIKIMDKGNCLVYVPEITKSDSFGPRVSIDFGTSVLMLDLEEFKHIARQILGIEYTDNIVQLRVVK